MTEVNPELRSLRGVDIILQSGCGFLNLRLDPDNGKAVKATGQMLGQTLPLAANTCTRGEHCIYWLGPDEWLIEIPAGDDPALRGKLAEALSGFHAAVNDVSGGYVALRLSGPEARTVLAKGCSLDLHPREFAPGQCARTGLAKATVLLAATDEAPVYTIITARSFAEYLCHWLTNAAGPQGANFQASQPIRSFRNLPAA